MMPFIIKDHTWSQTEDSVHIRVPVKGIRANKTTFVTADNYIRLYYPPYYFEVFLWGQVDDVNGKCTLNEEEQQVVFELPKMKPVPVTLLDDPSTTGHGNNNDKDNAGVSVDSASVTDPEFPEWPSLEVPNLTKPEKHSIRVRAVERSQIRAKDAIRVELERRHNRKQTTVREQIRLDEEGRRRIVVIKSFETESFMEEMSGWQDEVGKVKEIFKEELDLNACEIERFREVVGISGSGPGQEGQGQGQVKVEPFSTTDANEKYAQLTDKIRKCLDPANVFGPDGKPLENYAEYCKKMAGEGDSSPVQVKDKPESSSSTLKPIWSNTELMKESSLEMHTVTESVPADPVLAPIRQGGSIQVRFTPREFPTPSRESTAQLEEEWLTKQVEARKNCGFSDATLRPEERDPTWLLEKGHSLMSTGAHLGAATAFTTGLKLAPKLPQLFMGRAQAHLALNNLIKAVEDSSQAIGLLTPKVAQNKIERLSCHITRGSAFRRLKMYQEAIDDYREALRLDPDNERLAKDFAVVQQEELNADDSSDEGVSS